VTDADDWWWGLDGTVDWAVNPCGQTVELGLDGHHWVVTVLTPFAPGRGPIDVRTTCERQARRLFAGLAVLDAPAPAAAMRRWLRDESRRRGRGDHPAGGGGT